MDCESTRTSKNDHKETPFLLPHFGFKVKDLCISAWVPVRIVDDDSVGPSQIDSYAAHPRGQKKHEDGCVLQERHMALSRHI